MKMLTISILALQVVVTASLLLVIVQMGSLQEDMHMHKMLTEDQQVLDVLCESVASEHKLCRSRVSWKSAREG